MQRYLYFFMTLVCATVIAQTQLHMTRHYTWPVNSGTHADSVLSGLESIRCVAVDDLNNDGKNEVVVTNYNDNGHVCVFAQAAQDTFQLVWTSPTISTNGGYSSPRNVLIGDMDNDGKKEIIFESRNNGIFIYEWDGNPGYNFGTQPSQVINSTTCTGFSALSGNSYVEKMSLVDMDNDGIKELVLAYRAGSQAEQKYMIIKAIGSWSTNDPGFSSFQLLFVAARPNLATWELNAGSAQSITAANLDGTGTKEAVLQCYGNNDFTILRYNGTNWVLADTTNGKQNYKTVADGVSYFGGFATDIDKDGRDEVYLPTSISNAPDKAGLVRVIHYDSPATPNEIDSTKNIFTIDFSGLTGTAGLWGCGYGDIDGNGKPNIYFTCDLLGAAIVTAEFQGGDKKDSLNWKKSVLWPGDTCYHAMTVRDSLGKIDTLSHTIQFLWPSKILPIDLYKNGKEEIITGYQPWYSLGTTDSIGMTKHLWNSTAGKYDTITYKVINPKRIGFAVLEYSGATGVIERPLTLITPEDYKLEQNYPNPFNPSTKISFTLPINNNISLKIYDILGKEVRTLIHGEEYVKGSHGVTWDGTNNFGNSVASGTYIYRLSFETFEKSRKMMLLK